MEQEYQNVNKYDRLYGSSKQTGMMTKPSTVKLLEPVTGRCETFIIQTARHEEGDRIFIECVDESGTVTRMVLPFKVSSIVASQHDSLTKRRRKIASKVAMKTRMDQGYVPQFAKKRKTKQTA